MPKILWAEDGLDDQYLIKHALGQISPAPKVQFVEDGEAALAALGEARPDLVVLDINMPVLDGMETLKRMRGAEGTREVPVVVFSTGREESAVAACESLGVLDYIQKPFHYGDFTTAVGRICGLAVPAGQATSPKRA
jgi:two-component system, sensor histidine kinase and response regulator